MASSNPSVSDHGPPTDGQSARPQRWLLEPVRATAFWAAIALPFVHLPLLVSSPQRPATALAIGALLVVNVVALYVGRTYNRE